MSLDLTLLQVRTLQGALITPLTLFLSISVLFSSFVLIFILWSIISLKLTFFSLLKLSFLGLLKATYILSPPNFSFLNFTTKQDVAFMYATESLALVPINF